MVQKPELIAFAQYRLGGVQNFHYNILQNLTPGAFDLLWIFDDSADKKNARLAQPYNICKEVIFESDRPEFTSLFDRFKALSEYVSDRPGLIVTNFYLELGMLHLYRKKNKTIYFVCHDELYLSQAQMYEFLIDVYIAHNPQFYKELKRLFPHRADQIFYLPYGVTIPSYQRKVRSSSTLHVIFAARHVQEKGIKDLPEIIELADRAYGSIQWTILGDGPSTPELKERLSSKSNIRFANPKGNEEVRKIMAENDVFILPSYLDGLPVAMLESMSVGCVPILYKFNEGITEIIDTSTGFIIPSGDKQSFAEAIGTLYEKGDLLEQMSGACRNKVETEYDIKYCVRQYEALFNRYSEFKRPARRKFINYGGLLDHPVVPSFIRAGIRKLKHRLG